MIPSRGLVYVYNLHSIYNEDMIIFLKNKHTLQIDDFYFNCCIGKNGVSKTKIEGDKKTP